MYSTHIDKGASGTGVLGHPPARKAHRLVLKSPVPEHPLVYVCKIARLVPQLFFILKKCAVDVLWGEEEQSQ